MAYDGNLATSRSDTGLTHSQPPSTHPPPTADIVEIRIEPSNEDDDDHDEEEEDEYDENHDHNDDQDERSQISPSIFGTPPAGQVGTSKPRAIVRIERDYSARGATSGRVQFWDGWVEELEGRISPLQLQNTLNDLNLILASAYCPSSSIFDNTLAVLSLYISPWLLGTHYKRQMELFKQALEQYNRSIYNPVGLNILHPRKVAFLFLEIEYY